MNTVYIKHCRECHKLTKFKNMEWKTKKCPYCNNLIQNRKKYDSTNIDHILLKLSKSKNLIGEKKSFKNISG